MNIDTINSVFVYGTLMTGQRRAKCWPHPPLRITPARVRGTLYDLVKYPAMVHGDYWIGGERWEIAQPDLPATLETLDEIEGYRNSPHDLYRREIVECWDADDVKHWVFTYFLADLSLLEEAKQIYPAIKKTCRWPVQ